MFWVIKVGMKQMRFSMNSMSQSLIRRHLPRLYYVTSGVYVYPEVLHDDSLNLVHHHHFHLDTNLLYQNVRYADKFVFVSHSTKFLF